MRAAAPTAGVRTASPDISDAEQRVCLSLALWNGRDSILKERLFGLTNAQGNHGEDVKEQYFYLDATPSHSYLKMLYKYPQQRVSLCGAGRGECPTRHAPAGIRAPRYRHLRGGSLLRRIRRVCAGRARRHSDEDHGLESRSGCRPSASHSAIGVAQYLELGARLAKAGVACPWRWRDRHRAGGARRRAASTSTAPRSCCSRRTNPTRSGSGISPQRAISRTVFTSASSRRGATG